MKILHLIDSGGLYGAEMMLLSLVAEQQAQGIETMILSAGVPGIESKPIEEEARRLNLPVTPWRMKPGLNVWAAFRIVRWARRQGFDLLHSHGYKFNILMAVIPGWVRKLPVLSTVHGYVQGRRYSAIWLYELLDRVALRAMARVVLVSPLMKNHAAIRRLPEGKVAVIPNGISLEPVPQPPAPFRHDVVEFSDRFDVVLVAIGRLSPEKNFSLAIQALGALKARGISIGLCIMGQGPLADELRGQAEQCGVGDKLLMAGYVAGAESYLPRFDALVMPSLTEGLPITLLEAMKARVPVIASAVGGIPEALAGGKGGELVPPHNLPALITAFISLVSDRGGAVERADLAFETLVKNYSSRMMAAQYKTIYNSVIAPTKGRRTHDYGQPG